MEDWPGRDLYVLPPYSSLEYLWYNGWIVISEFAKSGHRKGIVQKHKLNQRRIWRWQYDTSRLCPVSYILQGYIMMYWLQCETLNSMLRSTARMSEWCAVDTVKSLTNLHALHFQGRAVHWKTFKYSVIAFKWKEPKTIYRSIVRNALLQITMHIQHIHVLP